MRWLLRLVLTLVTAVILLAALAFLLPRDRIATAVSERLAAATGRTITIEGPLQPTIWPVIGLRSGTLRIGNADWASQRPMLQAGAIDIGLDLAALWRGDIVIRRLRLHDADIHLERDSTGRENWRLAPQPAAAAAIPATPVQPPARPITLDEAQLSGSRITFVDRASDTVLRADDLDLRLEMPGTDGPARLELSGRLEGQPLALRSEIADPAALIQGQASALALDMAFAGGRMTFRGRGGLDLAAEGQIDIDAPAPARLLSAFGQPDVALPAAAAGPMRLVGTLNRTRTGTLGLRDATVTLSANRFRLDAQLHPGADRPFLDATISAEALDFSSGPVAPAPGSAAGAAPAARGWSTTPIDIAPLAWLDADLRLSAQSLRLGELQAGPVQIRARLDAARAVLDLQEIQLLDGTLGGEFVINGRGALSVGGNLVASEIGMQPLLATLVGQDRLIAPLSGRLRFLGSGPSVAAIMASLSGEGAFALGQGAIVGLDLVGMLRRLDMSYVGEGSRTIFDRITGSFTIAEGVLRNDDLAFSAPLMQATGSGRIDLGPQQLDYRLVTTALAREDGSGGLRVPFLIDGPWADPRIRLDLEGIARGRAEEERRALEARAEAEARRRLEELGVEAREGEPLEDTARRALEEEARRLLENEVRRGLGRLLGGN
ncbi:AsmA family protein [Plastorhodobacter daqingensis]|uniref:AsmA family protein n=1 Tax=Plastorhodobacter daqingensis TaxID=1387281 RepID=A0ABW2UKJ6_9RHOB